MKRILLFLLIPVMALSSCTEEDVDDLVTPRTEVPANMVGQWLYGTFSMIDYWKYDGSYVGNAFELSTAFDFKKNGEAEFYFIAGGTTYGCINQAFVYKKGTVEFSDNKSFTFYPVKGNSRGYYSCGSSSNFERDLLDSEKTPQTYYYTFETDDYGKEYMVIRFDPGDEYGSYFKPTQW